MWLFAYWTSEISPPIAAALLVPSGLEKASCSGPSMLCLVKTRKYIKVRQSTKITLGWKSGQWMPASVLPTEAVWPCAWLGKLSAGWIFLDSLLSHDIACSTWQERLSYFLLMRDVSQDSSSTFHFAQSLSLMSWIASHWPTMGQLCPDHNVATRCACFLGHILPECSSLIVFSGFTPCSILTHTLSGCPN